MNNRKTILFLLLLLIGVAVLTYPMVSNFVNQSNGSYAIQELQEQLENTDIAEQRRLAEEYNAKLAKAQENADMEAYNSILNVSGGMMGYLQIPKIDVNLPVYHGTGEAVLEKGVGHMPETAFPIGGEGNHSVLTGHTGLPSAKLFTDLTELAEGDTFYIHILGETLAYEIDQIKVVLPNEGQDLAAVPGEDYCTLVTCTPYGINSHRLLVRGSRTDLPQEAVAQQFHEELQEKTFLPVGWMIAAAMMLVFLIVIAAVMIRKRK